MRRTQQKRTTTYLGRNGTGHQIGAEVSVIEVCRTASVLISPVNSKGKAARCEMEIPIDEISQFIKALKNAVKDYEG